MMAAFAKSARNLSAHGKLFSILPLILRSSGLQSDTSIGVTPKPRNQNLRRERLATCEKLLDSPVTIFTHAQDILAHLHPP